MNAYVAAGYGVTLLGLAGYALHLARRAHALRARLAADDMSERSERGPSGPAAGRERTT